jgi:hypothetical protein
MKKLHLLVVLFFYGTSSYKVKGIINPMTLYTPLITVIQNAQNSAAIETLVIPPSTVTLIPEIVPQPAPASAEIVVSSSSIGTSGQIFDVPGYYLIASSINYVGTTSPITITSSNVTLDLNGQTISYLSGASKFMAGIIVNPGMTNVTIQNGTIVGFPGAGIFCKGTIANPVNYLSLYNIKVISGYQGIIVNNSNNVTITRCITTGNMNPTAGITAGIRAVNCAAITIQQCVSQNNRSTTASCYGYFLINCTSTLISSCIGSGNQGDQETAGIYLESMSKNNYVQNCACNGNSSASSDACGILISNSQQTYLQDSVAQGTSSNPAGFFSYGIRIKNSSQTFVKHNTIDGNDYGIYDDEPLGQHTNMFTQNTAYQNTISDYLRPNSSPLTFIRIQQEYLQGMLAAGSLDNISIRISS